MTKEKCIALLDDTCDRLAEKLEELLHETKEYLGSQDLDDIKDVLESMKLIACLRKEAQG